MAEDVMREDAVENAQTGIEAISIEDESGNKDSAEAAFENTTKL